MQLSAEPLGAATYDLEPGDALIATIEASIALAGFSGIVVVLGNRSLGEWLPVEELRLLNLLGASFQAFLISLLGILLLSANVPSSSAWVVCSVAWFLATALHVVRVIPRYHRSFKEDVPMATPVALWTTGTFTALVLLLQIINIVSLRDFWPVLAGIITNLALGARQFVHLLRSGR